MSTAHQTDLLGHRTTNKARVVLARVLVLPASALTIFTMYAVFDLATTTYIGSEMLTAQVITIAAGLLAVLAWIGVIALHKSARRELRPGPQHLMATALVATLVLGMLGSVGVPGWMPVVAYALTVVAVVTAFIGAVRM